MKENLSKVIFILLIVSCLSGFLNSAIALLCGFLFTIFFQLPHQDKVQKSIHYLLKIAVVGLGFGMQLQETLKTSREGFTLTALSILLTLTMGFLLAKSFKIDRKLSHLISSGTSICGGSAIAAISPIIRAEGKTISVAIAVVFFLNSIALITFPLLGKLFELNQQQFGLWSAIAIHDTSSVVGAALTYGDEALRIATTVKLSRVLWIIPLSIFSMVIFKPRGGKIKIPYFILAFVAAILMNSYSILPQALTEFVVIASKRTLVLTLFLVGTTLSVNDIKATGWKPMIFAFFLWAFISAFSLFYILL